MRVLSIDLGVTSGYVVMTPEERMLDHGIIDYVIYGEVLEELMVKFHPTDYLIEEPVIIRGQIGSKLQVLLQKTDKRLGSVATYVPPARWKNSPAAKYPLPGRGILPSQHEKDAYRMALWYLRYPNPNQPGVG